VGEEVNKENKSYGTYELLPMKFENTTAVSSNVNTSNVTETTNQTNTNTTAKTEATLNNNVSINVSLDEASKNQTLTTMLNTAIEKYLADPTNINTLFNAIAAMQTSNGNIISNVVKR
jgi:hypothetical protein